MSSFSIPTLFVVSTGNTLPTTGSTNTLTGNTFGIYRDDANDLPTAATAANAGAAKWLQLFQANPIAVPGVPNKRSDKIFPANVLQWYKIPTLTTVNPQITTITGIQAIKGEDINLTLRLFSNYIENAYWNGLTRTVIVQGDCIDCGDDPCESEVTDATYTALRDAVNAEPLLKQYITATVTGTVAGSNATLVLTAKALVDPIPNTSDVHNDPYRQDRLSFYTYLSKGTDVAQDFSVADRCDIPGTITVTQRGTYRHGSAGEVRQMEINYYSYSSVYKELFVDPAYNGAFGSVVDAADYDLYYLKYTMPQPMAWHSIEVMDEQAIIAVPTGNATVIENILTAAYGAPRNKIAAQDVSYSPLTP